MEGHAGQEARAPCAALCAAKSRASAASRKGAKAQKPIPPFAPAQRTHGWWRAELCEAAKQALRSASPRARGSSPLQAAKTRRLKTTQVKTQRRFANP